MTYAKNSSDAMIGSDSPPNTESSESFWERRYAAMTRPTGGRASAALIRFAEKRKPGLALDLGCARGDDAIWLARQGWTVTGVDVSETALRTARTSAEAAGLVDRTRFVRHDLGASFPDGMYDLVSAMFLQSPIEFGRVHALRRAAASVALDGLLLIATHGSRAPWSSAPSDMVYPTAREEFEALDLGSESWQEIFIGEIEREGMGPEGQRAKVTDTIVAVERR